MCERLIWNVVCKICIVALYIMCVSTTFTHEFSLNFFLSLQQFLYKKSDSKVTSYEIDENNCVEFVMNEMSVDSINSCSSLIKTMERTLQTDQTIRVKMVLSKTAAIVSDEFFYILSRITSHVYVRCTWKEAGTMSKGRDLLRIRPLQQ